MNKRAFRDMKSNPGRYLALFLLTVIAVGMYVGFLSGTDSAKETFVDYLESNRLEDGYFTLDGAIDPELAGDVEDLGVSIYENDYADERAADGSTLRIFQERKDIDLPWVGSGQLPQGDDQIFLDQLYAAEKSLQPGDPIEVAGKLYTVSGTGSFPDYTISLKDSTQMLADRSTFGVAMVSQAGFDQLDPEDITYNYSYLYQEDNLTDQEKKDKLREIIKTLACVSPIQNYGKLDQAFERMSDAREITAYSSRESNKRISAVTSKMDSNKSMATMFVGLVVLIIAFLYLIFTKHTIRQECSVLGTLLALGVGKGKILLSYLIGPCLLTLAGSLVGLILGTKVLYTLPINSLSGYYCLPRCRTKIAGNTLLVALLAPVVLILIINGIGILKNLHRKPLQLIRRDLKRNRGARRSHWNGGSFDFRFRLRMFFQSLGVYVLLFVGIFLGGWLMMFGVGMSSSFDAYIASQETEAVSAWQYGIKHEYVAHAKTAEEATVGSFDYESASSGQSYSLTGVGVTQGSQYFKDLPDLSYGQIALTRDAAKKFNLHVGEEISLENAATGVTSQYQIAAIADYNLGLALFTSQKEMNNILGKEIHYHNYYFSNEALEIPQEDLASETQTADYVANGQVIKDAMQSMILMFPAVAVIIYLILMYVLIKLVIAQNEVGISMLKVFGFTDKEIARMYLRTNTLVTLLLLLVALPLQYRLMVSIWPACIATIPGYVDFVMKGRDLALIALTGLICYLLANFTSMRKVKKVPMVMALKNQET